MKKIFSCPECRCKKFESISGLNVHLGKNHSVSYKIAIEHNRVVIRNKVKVQISYINPVEN